MSMAWIWVLVPIAAIFAGVVSTWIRVRHGYPAGRHDGRREGWGGQWHMPGVEADSGKSLKDALAAAEKKIASLEERVRVLERIATDRAAGLRDEIDGLQ